MKLSINNFFISCIILMSSMANAFGEDAPKSDSWYKTPLLSQTLDLPGQDATNTKQPAEIPQTQVTSVPPVADAPAIQAPQPVIPADSNPVNLPPKREVKLPKSNLKAISASDVRYGKSGEVRLEPSSAPAFPTRASTEQPEKPWYRKFYVRADYGLDKIKKQRVYISTTRSYIVRFKSSNVFGVGVGYKFNDFLRADLNLQKKNMHAKGKLFKKVSQTSVDLNTYFNLIDKGSLIPYLTLGVGHAKNSIHGAAIYGKNSLGEDVSVSLNNTVTKGLVWNVGAGATVRLSQRISLDFVYKYRYLGQFKSYVTSKTTGSSSPLHKDPFNGKLYGNEFLGGIILNI